MDSSMAVSLCKRLQSVAKLFRFVELFVAIAFISWMTSRLPFAVRISGEYCRRFSSLILSPISIFLLGNAIVLTLIAKSGLFSAGAASSAVDAAVADLYAELRSESPGDIPPAAAGAEEVVFQDKEIICEGNAKPAADPEAAEGGFPEEREPEAKAARYRRSKSEKMAKREGVTETEMKLRRSETDICRKEAGGGGGTAADELAEDDSSGDDSDEFRQTIEAFIAKQLRFHREERLAVVLHGQA